MRDENEPVTDPDMTEDETADAAPPPTDAASGSETAEVAAAAGNPAAAGDPAEGNVHAPEGAELDTVENQLREELEVLSDRHLRLRAEFDNYRRRMDGEVQAAYTRAQAALIGRFLDAVDDLQRVSGFEAPTTTVEALVEGVDLVERKFMQAFQEVGVEILDPTEAAFDPAIMEAMMKVPTENEEEDDQVHQVFQKGYQFKGQLVRPARVSVLKFD